MVVHTCKKCKRNFTKKSTYDYHVEHNVCDKEYKCVNCKKSFTTKGTLQKHRRLYCKNNNASKVDMLSEKIRQMQKELDEITKDIANTTTKNNSNNTTNSTTNNTDTVNNNTISVAFGSENIDNDELAKAFQGFNSAVKLTKIAHSNPEHPEYNNVHNSDLKNRYVNVNIYDEQRWKIIDKIYEDKKDFVENNLDDYSDKLSISKINAIKRWLNTDENDKKIDEIKRWLRLILHNKRYLPIDQKKNINK